MAKRTLTASELRRLAEAADGIRDQAAYVVWGANGPEVKTKLGKGDELIVECDTKSQVAERAVFQAITLDPPMVDSDGNRVSHVQSKYDAMFWSEASVEKFVIPYYSRFMTPHHLVRVMAAFNHPATTAMIHPPLSEIQFLTSIRTGDAGRKGVEVLGLREFEAAL